MSNRLTTRRVAVSAVLILLAGGCAVQPPAPEVLTNKQAHLDKRFVPSALDESVRKSVSAQGALPKRVTQVKLSYDLNIENETGTKIVQQSVSTMRDLGEGYVQETVEAFSNGIPGGTKFVLQYRGLTALRTQWIFPHSRFLEQPTEVKSISELPTSAQPSPGSEFTVAVQTGLAPQLINFTDSKLVCKAGPWQAAQTLHAKLPGRYSELSCERFNKGLLNASMKLAWFEDFGFARLTELKTNRSKEIAVISDVSVEL